MNGGPVSGTVKTWNTAEGWGVLTSPELPEDAWAHFSAIHSEDPDAYRELKPKEAVAFTWERAEQDGYSIRALEVRRANETDADTIWGAPPPDTPGGSGAFSSSLDISWDPDGGPRA